MPGRSLGRCRVCYVTVILITKPMTHAGGSRIALLYPGDREARLRSDPGASRFAPLFDAFHEAGIAAEPAIYHDDLAAEVQQQLQRLDGVLVWHNPIEAGRSRRTLDAMLATVA